MAQSITYGVLRFDGLSKNKSREIWERIVKSENRELKDIYKNPSDAKKIAFAFSKRIKAYLNGEHGRIIGNNCQNFSYGFLFIDEEGKKCVCYISRNNCYAGRLE